MPETDITELFLQRQEKSLDIYGGYTNDGTNIQQYTWNGSEAQLWKIVDLRNGYFYIRSKVGKRTGCLWWQKHKWDNVQLYSSNGSKAQSWVLKKLK